MKSLLEQIKPNRLTKIICLLLATITFALSLLCVSVIGKGAMTFGREAYFSNNTKNIAFTESYAFESAILDDLNAVATLAAHDKQAKDKNYKHFEYQLKDNDAIFKYYVESVDGTVFTNLSSKPSNSELKAHRVFLLKDDKKMVQQGSSVLKHFGRVPKGATVRIYLEDALFQSDLPKAETMSALGKIVEKNDYIAAKKMYGKMQNKTFAMMIALTIVCFLVSIALLVAFLSMVGRVETEEGEEKKIAFIDRVPGDIHAFGSFALFLACAVLGFKGLEMSVSDVSFWNTVSVVPVCAGIGGFLVLVEFLASACRSAKSGYGFWKHTLLGRLCLKVVRDGKYIGENGKAALKNIKNEPKQLGAGRIILALLYLFANLVLLLGLVHILLRYVPIGVFALLVLALCNIAVLTRFVRRFSE